MTIKTIQEPINRYMKPPNKVLDQTESLQYGNYAAALLKLATYGEACKIH